MSIQIECPGCKATIFVGEELAGKQGRCVQCGHKLTVPGQPARASASGGLSPTLFEATPESMIRELHRRQLSAFMVVFPVPKDGAYDLANVPAAELKCVATEDINQLRFVDLVAGMARRFAPGRKSVTLPTVEEQLYELKGDRLGMTLDEFKEKYARSGEGGVKLPLCSDTAWGVNKVSLRAEPWHTQAGIVNARIDLPAEENSPTVAGVKTELLLYHFVDGKLFRIEALLPTDQFHIVSEAAIKKYGPTSRESQKPRQLIWENPIAAVTLTRGTVHPREPSLLDLVHKPLLELAVSRAPTAAGDI
jgi:hypothetical protein